MLSWKWTCSECLKEEIEYLPEDIGWIEEPLTQHSFRIPPTWLITKNEGEGYTILCAECRSK